MTSVASIVRLIRQDRQQLVADWQRENDYGPTDSAGLAERMCALLDVIADQLEGKPAIASLSTDSSPSVRPDLSALIADFSALRRCLHAHLPAATNDAMRTLDAALDATLARLLALHLRSSLDAGRSLARLVHDLRGSVGAISMAVDVIERVAATQASDGVIISMVDSMRRSTAELLRAVDAADRKLADSIHRS